MSALATRFHLTTEENRAVESKGTTRSECPRLLTISWSATILFSFTLFFASACGRDDPMQPTSAEEEEGIKQKLEDRSFRQFIPSVDASPRKGVILDFFRGIRLWAQYSRDGRAQNEWEIAAQDYHIEKGRNFKFGNPEYVIHFLQPLSAREFPARCDNCIQTEDFSVSVRNLFDGSKISFKVNDPGQSLPPPFPVFETWTRFKEDEYFD